MLSADGYRTVVSPERDALANSKGPCVSVVMSVYNGEVYLREAIDSILTQTLADLELIIVNDGSTDSTSAILDSYRDSRIVRLDQFPNSGMVPAYNRAVKIARGEFIAIQDADDWSRPDRLLTEVTYLRHHSEVGVVGTAFYEVDAQGDLLELIRPAETHTGIRWQMLFMTPLCHGSMMFRRHLLTDDQLSYQAAPPVEDYDFLTRLLKTTRAHGLAEPLYVYRRHDKSTRARLSDEAERAVLNISSRQISELLPEHQLTFADLAALKRALHPIADPELSTCVTLLRLFSEFARQPDIDSRIVCSLRRAWLVRVIKRLSTKQWPKLWNSAFFHSICKYDPAALFFILLPELLAKISRRATKGLAITRSGRSSYDSFPC